jgi:hypothetical protein
LWVLRAELLDRSIELLHHFRDPDCKVLHANPRDSRPNSISGATRFDFRIMVVGVRFVFRVVVDGVRKRVD